jgi:hypothetical protein
MKIRLLSRMFASTAVLCMFPASVTFAEILPAIHDEYNATLRAQVPLEQGWNNPPRLARTRVWWWWLNGDNDKSTITRDLEAMKANGIGGANIIDAGGDNQEGNRRVPHGPDFGSKEWRELFSHAVAEAERLGLELGFNIQSGWNLGGPKVPIEESSKRVSFSKTPVTGGAVLDVALAQPPSNAGFYRDVAVLAVPLGKPSGTGARPSGGIKNLDQKAYFAYPGSFTGTESWHLIEDAPDSAADMVRRPEQVVDVTPLMDESGRLRWQAPAGNWEILRLGYTASGSHVSTHSENAGGHCIDYLDRKTLDSYWTRTLDPIFAEVKPYLGKSLRFLHTDSWELGPVNWTRNMPDEFKRLRGYDIKPFLPVLAGHIIGDRATSTRFLNDFRRTLADLMAGNKYVGFSEKAHALGLGIHPESGGPHAGPMDALRNLGISDVPMGEFWSTSPRHRVKDFQRFYVKQTTSAAHTYGRRVSLAEAFTNIGRHWQHDPRSLKATFDRAACEGHNLTMWHTFAASPKERGMPGSAYFAGEHFNPNVTWWTQGKAFIDYMNRCHFLLQQGLGTSDVLHFYGENVPAFVRLKRDDPAKCLPGYDYDVIDMRALMERTAVDASGNIVLPEGTSYRLLSLVPRDAISLPALEHVAELVQQGATMVGPRPKLQFSLTGGKAADDRFSALCDKLWGKKTSGTNRHGKGRVIQGMTTREVLQADQVPQDFAWTGGDADTFIDFIQRRTDDTRIYFVANRNDRAENVELRFRVTGRVPEFWDPVTGVRKDATDFREENGTTVIPYPMHGEQAFFVLFRKPVPAGGFKRAPNVAKLSSAQELTGPWEVSFDPAWGGPESITFDSLADWTSRPEEGIRHYSGSGIYQKTFSASAHQGPVFLDLGNVESLCEVKLNGHDLGVLWSAPFRVEITGKLKSGENRLDVKVVNVWANRIIGDSKLPESQRRTRTNITKLTKDTPLEPSGLLGPVRLWIGGSNE